MKTIVSLFTFLILLVVPVRLQSQETVIESGSCQSEEAEIKLKQYALTGDFRLVVQKPLVINLQADFLPGEATIHPEMISELNRVAKFLDWRIDSDLEVVVHADNPELSQARAASIKTFLVEKGGITADRIRDASQEGNDHKDGIEFRFITTSEETTEQQELRFRITISYSDSIPLTQVLLHSTIPAGWKYSVDSGTLGGSSINPVTVKKDNIIWDLGELGNQTGIELEFGLVPLDNTQIASISTLKSFLEYTYPGVSSAVTDAVSTSISTRVEESLFRIIISGATFDVNRWELKPEAASLLTPLGNFLSWQKDIDITITGFSDNRGQADWNQELSENRARSARDHLAQVYGISPDRMDVVGFGPQFPRASNSTADGRALNRRVEFTVNSDFQQTVAPDTVMLADSLVHEVSIPTVTISSMAGSPTNIFPIPVSVTFSENVTGFVEDDIIVGNGLVSNFTGSGTTYTFDVIPFADGYVTINIAANVAQDAAGENNLAAAEFRITFDGTAPTVTISSIISSPTDTSTIPITVTFSESVTGFADSTVIIGNGLLSNFLGSGTTYTLDITPFADGDITVDIGANAAQDAAGNRNTAATQFIITYDTTVPASWQGSTVYLVGGAALVLVGAGVAIVATREEPEKPAKIGLPPEWP